MWYIKRHGLFLEWLIVWLILSGIDAGMAAAFDLPNMKKRVTKIKTGVPELRRKASE